MVPPETSETAGPEETPEPQEVTEASSERESISEAEETTEPEDAAPEENAGAGATQHRSLRVPAALAAATILLGGFGVWATVQAHSLRSTTAGQNTALTDRAATAAVNRQISSAVNTIFSYNYADTAKTRQTAQSLLTGEAIRQYNGLFALVEQDAPKEKLVVTTTVSSSGVEFLTGDHARLLIFADQQDTVAGTRKTTYAGAMFAVTALRQDGRWKIEGIDTFAGG